MRASTERILVTHVGSMPRPREVVDLLARKEAGEPYDRAAFDAAMTGAVSEIVRKQLSAGVDVVSDGEQSKPSYATYVKDRLTGFSGDSPGMRGADLDDFPGFFRRLMSRRAGAIRLARPCCTGPIAVKDRAPLEADLARLRAALVENGAAEGFMNAASPGVIAVFQPNRHYATQAGYLEALAEAMRDEYRAIVDAGFLLQVDCPDLAMGRHVTYKGEGDDDFVRHAAEHPPRVLARRPDSARRASGRRNAHTRAAPADRSLSARARGSPGRPLHHVRSRDRHWCDPSRSGEARPRAVAAAAATRLSSETAASRPAAR